MRLERSFFQLGLSIALLVFSAGCAVDPAGVREIPQEGFLASADAQALILDVRSAEEFASGHVPGAVNIPHDQLTARLDELGTTKSEPVVVYCESGRRAGMATDVLLAAGFRNVAHLSGDMSEWRKSNRPVEKP